MIAVGGSGPSSKPPPNPPNHCADAGARPAPRRPAATSARRSMGKDRDRIMEDPASLCALVNQDLAADWGGPAAASGRLQAARLQAARSATTASSTGNPAAVTARRA